MAAAQKQEAPGGAWASPISSELIVSQSIGLGSPVIASDGRVFWLEGRPTEGGRQVLVSRWARTQRFASFDRRARPLCGCSTPLLCAAWRLLDQASSAVACVCPLPVC